MRMFRKRYLLSKFGHLNRATRNYSTKAHLVIFQKIRGKVSEFLHMQQVSVKQKPILFVPLQKEIRAHKQF